MTDLFGIYCCWVGISIVKKITSVDFREDYFQLGNFTGCMCQSITMCFCTMWKDSVFLWESLSVDCKQHFNSYFQVEPDRSGMLSFPLGFREGSCSNACPTERHVRGSRTTQDISWLLCVWKLVHGINCHCPLMSLAVQDSQTLSISEIWQGRIL